MSVINTFLPPLFLTFFFYLDLLTPGPPTFTGAKQLSQDLKCYGSIQTRQYDIFEPSLWELSWLKWIQLFYDPHTDPIDLTGVEEQQQQQQPQVETIIEHNEDRSIKNHNRINDEDRSIKSEDEIDSNSIRKMMRTNHSPILSTWITYKCQTDF